jgi:predicted RNA-binding Zn-ribbon protein involved in translation (DUF1610 family)
MKDKATAPQFGCPHCGSEEISENNTVQVHLRVSEWDEEGEPAGYAYPWRILDSTMTTAETGSRYHCDVCGEEFEGVVNVATPPISESA